MLKIGIARLWKKFDSNCQIFYHRFQWVANNTEVCRMYILLSCLAYNQIWLNKIFRKCVVIGEACEKRHEACHWILAPQLYHIFCCLLIFSYDLKTVFCTLFVTCWLNFITFPRIENLPYKMLQTKQKNIKVTPKIPTIAKLLHRENKENLLQQTNKQ